MSPRMALFSLTAALLYFGPFLSGLTGAPMTSALIFLAVYLLWVVLLRPRSWARTETQGAPTILAAYLGGLTMFQMVLIFVLFSLGRGLGTLLGGVIALPLILPIVLSAFAIPLGLMVREPQTGDAGAEEADQHRGTTGGAEAE
ncbi:hypothetical protein [Ostreiculturibacter nitratireducens]|uniref:hypothetical protein n=1 Tax=Ostreiculturibacter nitratireducens TaxID=3075226 RepID=UPI0031B5AE0B